MKKISEKLKQFVVKSRNYMQEKKTKKLLTLFIVSIITRKLN